MPQTMAKPPPHPALQTPNIWTQMSYTPPRGPCCQKPTLLSTTCPCHRFMQHPLQAASSYVCDGCGHHASYHALENEEEEGVLRRWEREGEMEGERRWEREKGRGEMAVVVGGKGERERERGGRRMIGGVGGEDEDVLLGGRKRRGVIGGDGGELVEIVDGEDEEMVPVASGRKRKRRW